MRGPRAERAVRAVREVVVAFVLGASAALIACGPPAASPSDGSSPDGSSPTTVVGPATGAVEANATVDRVVDGDTVDVVVAGREERVRLIGIDTPEKPGNGNRPPECFGAEATAFTASLLPEGTPLRLERDVEARDPYGRLLGYVYRATDGLFVNVEVARQGFAAPLTIPPNVAHADDVQAAVREARDAGRGLWAACGGPDVTLSG